MANLPTMSESNVSRKSSLEKVLPVMAKDISVMKTSLIKFMQSQTNQRTKAEAYFQRAKQKENLYEAKKSAALKSSTSPTKSGGSSTGLFDSKVGFFDFLKRIFNILTKGLLVGGAVFGIKKLLEDPQIRQNLGNFLKDIFVGILGLVRDGANLFSETLQKNGPEIQKALTETFVAIMGAIESAINGLTNLLTGPNSKEIYDSIGRVFTAIGNAIVKVFTTKIDIKGIEVPLGLVIAGLAALPAVLSGFGLAIRNATAAALGFGATAGRGAGGAIGGIISMVGSGIRAAIAAALLAYAGSEAYNAWKKKNPDRDSEGNAIDPKSQLNDRMVPGAYDQQTGYLDSGKLAVGAAEVAGGVYAGKKIVDWMKSSRGATVPAAPSAPSPSTGFPRGAAPTPIPATTAQLPTTQSNIIQQSAGSGARDYERTRSMYQAEKGFVSGKRAPLPPQEEGIIKKIVERIKTLSSKGSKYWGRFLQYVGKRVLAHYGTVKGATVIAAKMTGAVISVAAAPFSAGITTLIGYGLLAADLYFLYTVIEDFFKEQKLDNAPTQAITDPVGDASFRDQMTQGANRSREESIDIGDSRGMAENYLGRRMSDKEWDMLVRATYAEGSGKSTEEYAAIMAVILNRSRKSGRSIKDILEAPNQFQAVTGTSDKPGPSSRYTSGPSQKDFDMITQGTGILSALSTNLDSFTSADRKAYKKGTNVGYLDKLLASGGTQIGGSVFAEGLYGSGKPSMNTSARLRTDSNQVNNAERNRKDAEDARNDPIVNIIDSFNQNKQGDAKPASGTAPPVSTPYNEEMFFREQMKSMFQ
jgi:spore germination cell wall hydrolase CwlJ-like protein